MPQYLHFRFHVFGLIALTPNGQVLSTRGGSTVSLAGVTALTIFKRGLTITPEEYTLKLEQELKASEARAEAFRQEFLEIDPNDEKSPLAVRKQLAELVPTAVTALRQLLTFAEKDSTRFAAARFVIETHLKQSGSKPDDELNKLLSELKRTPTFNKAPGS